MTLDWIDLLARNAKERKQRLDAAVRAFLDQTPHGIRFGTAALAEALWPTGRENHPRAFGSLCKHLTRMAPYFPDGYAIQHPPGEDGKRHWQWYGNRYTAADKVREEIANNPDQWS